MPRENKALPICCNSRGMNSKRMINSWPWAKKSGTRPNLQLQGFVPDTPLMPLSPMKSRYQPHSHSKLAIVCQVFGGAQSHAELSCKKTCCCVCLCMELNPKPAQVGWLLLQPICLPVPPCACLAPSSKVHRLSNTGLCLLRTWVSLELNLFSRCRSLGAGNLHVVFTANPISHVQ